MTALSPTQRTVLWVYAALVAVWPVRHLVLTWVFRSLDVLTPRSPRFFATDPPLVTAVIPAKDEEGALGECLASVASQDYPNLEILIVDDRSTDGTAAVARRFAEGEPRARVITIDHLPGGWTGKTHALHVAAGQARGGWFWFLDADTRHTPENLGIVMEYARGHNAALASLIPELRCETFWEGVVQPLAGIVLIQSFPLIWVNDDRKRLAFANGQYLLIRRDAYQAAGGHAAVRQRFVEDIALAERVKGRGFPIRVAIAHGLGSTRMYASLGQLVRGWSRILYDALGRSPIRLGLKVLDPLVFSQTAHVALAVAVYLLLTRPVSAFALGLLGFSVAHHVLAHTVLRRLYLLSVPGSRYVGWYPLGNLVMDWVLVRSIAMCVTGRVTWRGTAYGPAVASPEAVVPPRVTTVHTD